MGGKPWTKDERNTVLWYWGTKDIGVIAKRLGRSAKAVEHVSRLLKLPRVQETETLTGFCTRTGYSDRQVHKAIKALHLSLRRQPRTSVPRRGLSAFKYRGTSPATRAITPKQAEQILAWLVEQTQRCWRIQSSPDGVWGVGKKPVACLVCGTNTRPHQARGLCLNCYQASPERRAVIRERVKARRAKARAARGLLPIGELKRRKLADRAARKRATWERRVFRLLRSLFNTALHRLHKRLPRRWVRWFRRQAIAAPTLPASAPRVGWSGRTMGSIGKPRFAPLRDAHA